MLLSGSQPLDCLFAIFIWISITVSSASASLEQKEGYQTNRLQSDKDSAAFYKFPNPYCKHVGQFLPHPTNKCVYLRCDYGTEHWIGKKGNLPLFTIEQSCPPGTSVNRTTFYYARYRQEDEVEGEEDNLHLDPNDPYNFPVSPCTIVDPDCALVVPPTEEPKKSNSKPSRRRYRPRYRNHQRRRHNTQQPITDENNFIRPEDLPDAPGNPYR